MIRTIEEFYLGAEKVIEEFDVFAERSKAQNLIMVDHICYKCASTTTYEQLRSMFEFHSYYIYQSFISDRRIAYIRLMRDIPTKLNSIGFLELSDQRPDGSQIEGYDHIEIYPPNMDSHQCLVTKLAAMENLRKVVRPHQVTYEVTLTENFHIKCATGPLLNKIITQELPVKITEKKSYSRASSLAESNKMTLSI